MAFDGLGGKMVIHKVTDVARDAASQQRRADLMQNLISKQVQNEGFNNHIKVQDTNKPSDIILQRERNKKNHRAAGRMRSGNGQHEEDIDNIPQGGITTDEKGHMRVDIRI